LEALTEAGASQGLVVDRGQVIGAITARAIMAAYKSGLGRSMRRLHQLGPDATLVEAPVAHDSPLVGQPLRAIRFPGPTLVLSIARQEATLFPRADTVLVAGDQLLTLTEPGLEARLKALLAGGGREVPPTPPVQGGAPASSAPTAGRTSA
ncbi:MAG TPA: TrkA C-terminal domain-containing protein, partial [Thermomicrobiales bacterium]|nr:TrkA C-terminal domain-containing protein [Thermomicrobiales bacterium]